MTLLTIRNLALTAVLSIALSACAGSSAVTERPQTDVSKAQTGQVTVSQPTTNASHDALESLYWARQDSARMRFTEADVQFMTGMIGHHAQALIMSRLAPTNGASAQVRTLAARIINAQQDEIAAMQKWLADRGQPVPEVHIDGMHLMVHGAGEHAMHMPGMLSQAQLNELEAAKGPEFDRLFLKYMIQHHGGALTMVDDLFREDGAGQDEAAFRLASDINVDQITEIARMQGMLDILTGSAEDR